MTPPRLSNALLRSKVIAGLAKRAAGIDARRGLPRFSTKRLRKLSARSPGNAADAPDVWIWADSFTDHFASENGVAALRLFAQAGIDARVIPERACCALTWITTGQLDQARRIVTGTIATLHPYVSRGVPIVGLEPSCLAALRSDLAEPVRDDPDLHTLAEEIGRSVVTLAECLTRLAGDGRWTPPDLAGTEIVVQPHCHQASVLGFQADLDVLEGAGAKVTRLGGCCGLAGNFGVEQGHYETSVAVAEQTLLPAVRNAPAGSVILADGMSCRIQLADLAGVPAVHLAQLLAPTK